MVVLDTLTNTVHFITVKMTHKGSNIAAIQMKEIARIHGVPKEIISNRDTQFTSNFGKGLFKGFGTNMNFSTTYPSKSHGKIERVI
jgi:hypothetical protein